MASSRIVPSFHQKRAEELVRSKSIMKGCSLAHRTVTAESYHGGTVPPPFLMTLGIGCVQWNDNVFYKHTHGFSLPTASRVPPTES